MGRWRMFAGLGAAVAGTLALAACGGGEDGAAQPQTQTEPSAPTPAASAAAARADLTGVKRYLLDHTKLLTDFTAQLERDAERYYALAKASGFDPSRLWDDRRAEVAPLLVKMKKDWVAGNPYYEQMEGIVAGTPSLSEYDVVIDAGSSAEEDPASAVPFDLKLPDGRVVKQPGNFYNITEGALWGTLPEDVDRGQPADLDGNGSVEFGEVLPDPAFLVAAAREFDRYARELDAMAKAWQPADSDAFTALVVMVPTMSEYFGQWKVSRFVLGDRATGEAFNVVSRLSDIGDIIGSLEVIYEGVQPLVAKADEAQSVQTGNELGDLSDFIGDLREQEASGKRFTPEQAELLGSEAQERGTAIAGQISQAAAELGIRIDQ